MAKSPSKPKVTMWEMLRDIFIAAMNRGQLLGITLAFAFLIFVIRAPSENLVEFARILLQGFQDFYYVGYILFGATLIGWRAHVRRLTRTANAELQRMAEERNALQSERLGGLLESSNDGGHNE